MRDKRKQPTRRRTVALCLHRVVSSVCKKTCRTSKNTEGENRRARCLPLSKNCAALLPLINDAATGWLKSSAVTKLSKNYQHLIGCRHLKKSVPFLRKSPAWGIPPQFALCFKSTERIGCRVLTRPTTNLCLQMRRDLAMNDECWIPISGWHGLYEV